MKFISYEGKKVELQSSRTTLRSRRVFVQMRMHTTKVDTVRQNITRIAPSVFKLLGLTKLECIPGGAGIAGSLNRTLSGILFNIIILADVNKGFER